MKIPKACEPCRRRKIKCSGEKPCQHCDAKPSDCIYRLKPRVRLSAKQTRTAAAGTGAEQNGPTPVPSGMPDDGAAAAASGRSAEEHQQHAAQTEVYHSVAATHHAPKSTDSSQLYYGPSSNSAFLQQIHRGLLSGQYSQTHGRDVQEGGPGLDMFMQRNIFFGMPLKVRMEPCQNSICPVTLEQAAEFVEQFKKTHLPTVPFFTSAELDEMLPVFFGSAAADTAIQPQRRTVFIAALALGALSTPHTEAAESLFIYAKKEAIVYEDAVTLAMIQYSMLLAHYQLSMGRPNSAYLHMGAACRKALAMGLHSGTTSAISRNDEVQARLITLWSLYFLEIWLSLVVGRRSMVGRSDFASCPYPDGQPAMVALCQFASLIEEAVESIYNRRTDSLRQLYTKAEKLFESVRQHGDRWGLGSVVPTRQDHWNAETSLLMHNVYFHAVLIIFHTPPMPLKMLSPSPTASSKGQKIATQTRRYLAFFIESCCAVLLYDSLRHPSKHPHNLEYIQMAISSLHSLVGDEPVTNALRSIKRIVLAVEQSISAAKAQPGPALEAGSTNSSPAWSEPRLPTNIQFPSLDENRATNSDDLIFFSNRAYQPHTEPVQQDFAMSLPAAASMTNPFADLSFDVLTTDLFKFFPIDMNGAPSHS
ncbi:putative transcriptional regulatory protein [Colletotrichum trifolii]|uniref:Putative transcriptional regulatory protein n=1 Tax=Colletotrichum trifolii TaxID=5466 RepID=A0A4R8RYB3_COLTR|nr:putative transcriptional regulatory protein [Colletotrichum trifolii]